MEKDKLCKQQPKEKWNGYTIKEKVFKTKFVTGDKEEYFITIKLSANQE